MNNASERMAQSFAKDKQLEECHKRIAELEAQLTKWNVLRYWFIEYGEDEANTIILKAPIEDITKVIMDENYRLKTELANAKMLGAVEALEQASEAILDASHAEWSDHEISDWLSERASELRKELK